MNLLILTRNLLIGSSLGLGLLIGCSPVGFEVSQDSCEDSSGSCVVTNATTKRITSNYSIPVPKLDILFVVDNSGSMAVEQANMGNRFNSFTSSLNGLNWQMGVTTADISYNQRALWGEPSLTAPPSLYDTNYQDGKLLSFGSSTGNILVEGNPNASSLFRNTVQIEQQGTYDERGIVATTMALQNNYGSLIRTDSNHVAVVILSDEDVRSIGLENNTDPSRRDIFPVEYRDTKEYLADVWNSQINANGTKTISVHSIVVKPGDNSCLNAQTNQQGETGHFGSMYADLSNDPRFKGITGSICANDYASQLSSMGSYIRDRSFKDVPLDNCAIITNDPVNHPIQITVTTLNSGTYTFDYTDTPPSGTGLTSVSIQPGSLTLNPALPAGTSVGVSYSCPR